MGFATVASAKFTDDSSVNYKEAVDVMSAIGVINGYTDNSFRPTANVTRAQMAKMVAYILASGDDVGSLYAGANSFSDCTTHWAKGYIAYASKTGIVAGVGGGKFNPEGSVTGTQAAKMMLCALGYDAAIETYTGSTWAVNVLADAKEAGLLKGLEKVNMSAAMTREQAAQLMFNALKATMVKYSNKGSNIIVDGITINTGASSAESVKEDNDKLGKATTLELGEKYFEDLKLIDSADTVDNYGRPAHQWKNGKESVGYYGDEPDEIFTEGFTKSKVTDLKKDYDFDSDTKIYVNGEKATSLSVNDIAGRDYKGTVIELYADDDDDITHVVLVQAYAAEVTTLTKTTITLKVYNPWATSKYVNVSFKDDKDEDDDTYDTLTAAYEKGDYLLTYFKGADVAAANYIEATDIDSFDAKVSTKKITDVDDGYNGYFTADGAKYTLASGYNEVAIKAGSSYTFYTDANGYVIAAVADDEAAATIDDVYYIANVWKNTEASYGENVATQHAQLVAMDGKITEVELESQNSGEKPYDSDAVIGKLVTISDKKITSGSTTVCKAADDKYNVTEWKNEDWDVIPNVTGTFTKDATRFTVGGTTYRLNSSTQYLLVGQSGKNLEANVKTGGIAYAIKTGEGPDKAYIITEDGSSVVKYVIIASASEISEGQTYSKDAIYLAEIDEVEEGDGYYARKVYMADGNDEVWQLDSGDYAPGFYTYDKNSDGYYTLKTATDMASSVTGVWDEQEGVVAGTFKALFEGLLSINKTDSGSIEDIEAADAVVIDVHDVDEAGNYDVTVASLEELSSLKDDNVISSASLIMNVSKDGAVIIFITDIDAAN